MAVGRGVLRRVREELGGDEVGVPLDRRGQRGIREVDLDDHRHGAARRERLEAGREPAVLQDRRRESAGQRAQLVERLAGLLARLADERLRRVGVLLEPAFDRREVHLQSDEPLLRAVVDVALEASERGVLGLHGGAARRGELGDLDLQRLGAPGAEHAPGDHVVQEREPAEHERQRGEEHQAEQDLEDPLADHGVVREVVAGQEPVDEPFVQPERAVAGRG